MTSLPGYDAWKLATPPESGEPDFCEACNVQLVDDYCPKCGVDHSGLCDFCGRHGFHANDCSEAEPEVAP